jgi:hypothetical protein
VEDVVRNFVGIYSTITGEIDVVRPRLQDLDQTTVYVSEEYRFDTQSMSASFEMRPPRFHFPHRPSARFFKDTATEEKLQQFSALLRQGYILPLSGHLMLDAKEQAHLRQQYDVCIILLATAFEVFLREVLVEVCKVRGIKELARQSGKTGKPWPYKHAIEKGHVLDDLLVYVEQVGGRNYKGQKAYNEWRNDAYEVRNAIVHRGKRGCGDAEADKAYTATALYMEAIQKSLQ